MPLPPYATEHPSRTAVEEMRGSVVMEFGVDWCPHCQRAAGPVAEALRAAGALPADGPPAAGGDKAVAPATPQYLRLEDDRARPLGRSFKVKLWPTLLFLRDGVEVARVVRPTTAAEVTAGLGQLVQSTPMAESMRSTPAAESAPSAPAAVLGSNKEGMP